MHLPTPRWPLKRIFARRVVPGVVGLLVAMQMGTCSRTNPPVIAQAPVPSEVGSLLRKACYDCHSNETVWPWYSRVAPVSWLVWSDVTEGRQHLNFSEWPSDVKIRHKHLTDVRDEISGGDMPLWFYLPMHSAARLTSAQKQLILEWTRQAESTF